MGLTESRVRSLVRLFIFCIHFYSITALANDFSSFELLNGINGGSDIFRTILNEYSNNYQNIAQNEAQRILAQKDLTIVGGLNSIGLSYHRPFTNFNFSISRTLAPDLFDAKRWIVTDMCSIEIDASKFLSKLKNKKIINISDKNLLAYAGIFFKRDYTWIHYAESYESGLTTHFEKLFFPFTKLSKNKISTLDNNEIIFREDKLSSSIGALATAPIYQGISAAIGGYSKFQILSKLEVINYDDIDRPYIQISREKFKSTSIGLSAELQIDLLKILKIKLFGMESSFDRSESYKIYLNIPKLEMLEWAEANPKSNAIDIILTNKDPNISFLSDFIISEEKRSTVKTTHKYNFLLLGATKQAQTEQVEILSSGKLKKFFKHNFEKIKFQEDILSKLFASLIYTLTQTEASAAKLVSETKRITIEYEDELNLIDSRDDLTLADDHSKISLTFNNEFSSKQNKKAQKNLKNKLIHNIEYFSSTNLELQKKIQTSDQLTPFDFQSKFLVNSQGLRYFNSLSVDYVLDNLNAICDQFPKNKFFNFRNLFDHCKNSLSNDYMDYVKDLTHNRVSIKMIDDCEAKSARLYFSPGKKRSFIKQCLMNISIKLNQNLNDIPMWSLKNLVVGLGNNVEDKVYFYNLFGIENVFNTGFINLTLDNSNQFYSSFYAGSFKGFGVIENFKNTNIYRLPASVDFN